MEYIVYCEVEASSGGTNDEVFWQNILHRCGLKCKCKSFGSKSQILLLAHRIVNEGIPNTLVAMDRDYDFFRGLDINHRSVLYSYGYSWESDVVFAFDIGIAIAPFAAHNDLDDLGKNYKEFKELYYLKLKRMTALDLKYIDHPKSLFDRSKPMSIILSSSNNPPSIDVAYLVQMAKNFGKFQSVKISKEIYNDMNGFVSFFGKSIARLIYHWFVYQTRKYTTNTKVAYATFIRILSSSINPSPPLNERDAYYMRLCDRLLSRN